MQSHLENRWVFRRQRNYAKESASLITCGRAFHSLGAELEESLKPMCFIVVFFQQLLEFYIDV